MSNNDDDIAKHLANIPDIDPPSCISARSIQAEIEKLPLFSDKLPISSIVDENIQDELYHRKMKQLQAKFSYIRQVRRDGNCFYRAFAFRFFERFKSDHKKLTDLKAKAGKYKEKLIDLKYPEISVCDFHDTFVEFIDQVIKNGKLDLMNTLGDKDTSLCDYIVVVFRLYISVYLQEHSEFFQAFLTGDKTLKQFCSDEVEPMSTEADHLQVLALTSALEVPIEVVYLDRSVGDLNIHKTDENSDSDIKLLYRPSHYDILY
ncbi:hypothetical protein GJ496_004521 [Pomphorhynchus laevis]|nr:hypothetical protein GJ496_004521 [Pomphorhynchus laevis]